MAADPTYPLYPVLCFLSAVLLLILLTTSFVRQSWNLGVTFLCFWLFWENLFLAINSIIWADNADLKLYVYCDIVSHLYMFTYIVKPACTLILTRRLYKIVSMQALIPDSRREKVTDALVEWSLGLGLPALVTGVFYYIVQGVRFKVYEGLGCEDAPNASGVQLLLVESPVVILPAISALFYCPKIVCVLYRHTRDTNRFLRTNGSVSRGGYSRIFALGLLDIILTLPFGIMQVVSDTRILGAGLPLRWYDGWGFTHSNWEPVSIFWSDVMQSGTWTVFNFFFNQWSSVILALVISALFSFTTESRATYRHWICGVLKLFGWTPPVHKHQTMSDIQFKTPTAEISGQTQTNRNVSIAFLGAREDDGDTEQGLRASVTSDLDENKYILPTVEPAAMKSRGDNGHFSQSDVRRVSSCTCP